MEIGFGVQFGCQLQSFLTGQTPVTGSWEDGVSDRKLGGKVLATF